MIKRKEYSLRRCTSILKHGCANYDKKGNRLIPQGKQELAALLEALQAAIAAGKGAEASRLAKELEVFNNTHFKKSFFDYGKELSIALVIALLIAIPVRQMWFELYEIPTGSMRPTFEEGDKLTVTKTTFGINKPLEAHHFYFDPSLVERTGVVILAGDNLDLYDTESSYFGIIPYSKRYIKRLVAKPGDTLYFYGGLLWAVDSAGNEVQGLRESPWMKELEYVPFLSFDGRQTPSNEGGGQLLFKQMNQPIARLTAGSRGPIGEIHVDGKWAGDNPQESKKAHGKIETYSDFYGMGNFGMAKLLTKKELEKEGSLDTSKLEEAPLYLLIGHHPNMVSPPPKMQREGSRSTIHLVPSLSIIPLQQKQIDRLMESMYTARFIINGGFAKSYGARPLPYNTSNPRFPDVADGTYELYHGIGYSIGWGSVPYRLPEGHPLYSKTAANVQKLYNYGINFDKGYTTPNGPFPNRYVYFRDGDLYAMGKPLVKKEEPQLQAFVKQEEAKAVAVPAYLPFVDEGAPLKGGAIDAEKIKAFGLKIPERSYLVLGDNHAMSADSRVFGFVPEENLQGTPSLILWPPGARWGFPLQQSYPLFTLPRLAVWATVAAAAGGWYGFYRWRRKKLLSKKIK